VYVYQATIFTAALSIDQRRIRAKRNSWMPWVRYPDWVRQDLWNLSSRAQKFSADAAHFLLRTTTKVVMVLITAAFTAVGIWGLTLLRQEFNPVNFIPKESYLSGWLTANSEYFPEEGERVMVNIADIDYTQELPKLENLMARLLNETDILTSVDSWYLGFRDYAVKNKLVSGEDWLHLFQSNQVKFYAILTQYLFSPEGAKYRRSFNFVNDLTCGEAAPKVLLSSIQLTHKLFYSSQEWIPAMNKVKQIVAEANFSSRAFPTGTEYASWETDEVIGQELYQNMGISLVCVLATTLLFMASFTGCGLVFLCVILTLVDVGGFMHFWGLTIDVISCVNLVIAVGLCVDYAAHIVHCFLLQTGQ